MNIPTVLINSPYLLIISHCLLRPLSKSLRKQAALSMSCTVCGEVKICFSTNFPWTSTAHQSILTYVAGNITHYLYQQSLVWSSSFWTLLSSGTITSHITQQARSGCSTKEIRCQTYSFTHLLMQPRTPPFPTGTHTSQVSGANKHFQRPSYH